MARSSSLLRSSSCDCLSRSPHRICRCPSRQPGPRRDRRLLSRIEQQVNFRGYQSFSSLDTQLPSSIEGPHSPDSTYSIVSHDNAGSVNSTTADLEDQRHFSPPFVATPASSDASFTYPPHQYSYSQRQDGFTPPSYPQHSFTLPPYGREPQNLSPTLPFEQPSHLLAGIGRIAQSDEAAGLARQRLEFVSPQGPSPTQHQQYPKKHEPWNTESLRSEDVMVLDQRSPPFPVPENSLSPTSSNDKGSRRNGPLTAEARRNANLVRQMRACRRCVYMKEPCNGQDPCQNCQGKKGRKWKAGCTRYRLHDLRDILFPAPIADRHRLSEVNKYIYNTGFFYLARPEFRLKLDTGLSRPLEIIVKEIEVMDTSSSELQAFQTRSSSEQGIVKAITIWNPPIVPYMTNKDHDVKKIRAQLRLWLESVLQARNDGPDYQRWPWPCFEHQNMNWEGEVVEAILDYYRPEMASHDLLHKAHSLLFFGYILDHSFLVPEDSRETLLGNLQNPPLLSELEDREISPETITRFIKMIVCGYALELSRSVLAGLQDILHGMALGKETSTARTDLAFCLTFLLLVFLAQSQNRILMLAELSKLEPGINLSWNEAEHHITEMEHTLGSYMIHFHEFAVKRRKHAAQAAHVLDADEKHAQDKNLMGQVSKLFSNYSPHARPPTLELETQDINVFEVRNTHRLCWKFVAAILDR